jgi:hypothetical protein
MEHMHDVATCLAGQPDSGCMDFLVLLERFKAVAYIPEVETMLSDPDPEVRTRAVLALAKAGARACSADIARLLADRDARVRKWTVRALVKLRAKETLPLLAERLGDPDADVRSEAALALGCLGDEDAAEPLLFQARHDRYYIVRWSALWALNGLADRTAHGVMWDRTGSKAKVPGPASLWEAIERLFQSYGLEPATPCRRESYDFRQEFVARGAYGYSITGRGPLAYALYDLMRGDYWGPVWNWTFVIKGDSVTLMGLDEAVDYWQDRLAGDAEDTVAPSRTLDVPPPAGPRRPSPDGTQAHETDSGERGASWQLFVGLVVGLGLGVVAALGARRIICAGRGRAGEGR